MKFADQSLEIKGPKAKIARVISRLTPAPLFNLYVGVIFISTSPIGIGPILSPVFAFVICVIFMVILPITPIVIEAWRGNVDLDVSEQSMRGKFFLYAIGFYIISLVFYYFAQCTIMFWLSAAYITVTSGIMISTHWSKVSVHAAGVGGPSTALLIIYGVLAWPVIIVWTLVIWSRVFLHQHTLRQAVAGLTLAIIITLGTYVVLLF